MTERRLSAGETIGKWIVKGVLGEGGMGTVYDVVHDVTGRPGALKVLRMTGKDADVWSAKMLDEARMLGRLCHPNLVDVFDASDGRDGLYWMVMEKLQGRDLGDVIKQEGALSLPRALGYAESIASAASAAHGVGVIHRDIKPDNAHVSDKEVLKVIDFGASRFKQGRTVKGVIGTIPYMSPEQLRSPKTLDARSDIWSLGMVLYEMLAGRHLFTDASGEWFPRKQVINTILAPGVLSDFADVDERVRPLIQKATAKDRERRYGTMADFAAALQQLKRASQPMLYAPTERLSALEISSSSGSFETAPMAPGVVPGASTAKAITMPVPSGRAGGKEGGGVPTWVMVAAGIAALGVGAVVTGVVVMNAAGDENATPAAWVPTASAPSAVAAGGTGGPETTAVVAEQVPVGSASASAEAGGVKAAPLPRRPVRVVRPATVGTAGPPAVPTGGVGPNF